MTCEHRIAARLTHYTLENDLVSAADPAYALRIFDVKCDACGHRFLFGNRHEMIIRLTPEHPLLSERDGTPSAAEIASIQIDDFDCLT